MALNSNVNIYCAGNSITYGSYTSNPATDSWPVQLGLMPPLLSNTVVPFNGGHPGKTTVYLDQVGSSWGDGTATGGTGPDDNYVSGKTNILFFLEIINDIYHGASAQQAFDHVMSYAMHRKSIHPDWKIFYISALPIYQTLSGQPLTQTTVDLFNSAINWVNNRVRNLGHKYFDGYVDLRGPQSPFSDANFPDYTWARFVNVAQVFANPDMSPTVAVHLSRGGERVIADIVLRHLNNISA